VRSVDGQATAPAKEYSTMKIAQVAPLTEAIPPKLYGGTERIVSYLTEELVALGHSVTLFASGDSQTSAQLEVMSLRALRFDRTIRDVLAPHILMLEKVAQRAAEFDIIHLHLDHLPFPLFRRVATPKLATLHGRLDLPELAPLYDEFNDFPVVSISEAQRDPLPQAHWADTVHHGLPIDLHQPRSSKGSYLAFLGRISPEKRPDLAIKWAVAAGRRLRIAAKVDAVDMGYFTDAIEPLLSQPGIEFIGEISEKEKTQFLGEASALLFPIDWPEPFGLVMIEAMACGTPVIAFNRGSVPEVIEDGVTGFVITDEAGALDAIRRIEQLDRRRIRESFEQRYTARRMAEDYLAIYQRLSLTGTRRLQVV
jgi:glycosyltransferase involved in cell wall biosynthesis